MVGDVWMTSLITLQGGGREGEREGGREREREGGRERGEKFILEHSTHFSKRRKRQVVTNAS